MATRLRALLVALVTVFSIGCQAPHPTVPPSRPQFARGPVLLGPGDVVTVSFVGTPELNQSQQIRADGNISLPLVGDVHASGRSLDGLREELVRLYRPQLKGGAVSVGLQVAAAAVYVSGAVNSPRKVPLDRPMTALEAIMEAGGFTSGLANPKKVTLIRQENGRHETSTLDLSGPLHDQSTEGFYLKPYDMLIVQEKTF